MGNKPLKLKDSIIIDRLIIDCFKDSDLEVPVIEINKLKVHFREGEKYFRFKFDYLIYYNNKIFHDGLPSLYDNYMSKVEQFSSENKQSNKIFTIFIDFEQNFNFDDEDELEFEPIFTIIFEKLEIKNISCFYFYDINTEYVSAFFEQLYENIFFYKATRNYESLYFLMPNEDYFIKNENYLLYIGIEKEKVNKGKKIVNKFHTFKSPFNEIIFNTNYFIQLLNVKSKKSEASQKIFDFLKEQNNISYFKYISEINFAIEDKLKFIKIQKKFYDFHNTLCSKAANIELIFLTKTALNKDNVINISNLIQYIITNSYNSSNKEGVHLLRIIRLDFYNNDERNEENEDEEKEKNDNIKCNKNDESAFFILDKFIQIVLNLLNKGKTGKRRKLIIDYFNVYDINLPKNKIENNQKIEKLMTDKKEVFINNLEENDIEDSDTKENTIYHYTREKLEYEWFVHDLTRYKLFIIFALDSRFNQYKNIVFNKLNKKGIEDIKLSDIIKIKKIIFSYIFQEKSNKYFFAKYTKENIKDTEAKFEKLIFE